MRISQTMYVWGILACCLLSVVFSVGLLYFGYASASADESARALIANDISWSSATKPFIWPPFYDVVIGLWLRIYPDLFYAPRVISSLFGVLSLLALVALSLQLFEDRLVALLTAILGLFLHHRLLLSAAPMSEAFFNCFVFWSACGIAHYSRHRNPAALVFSAVMCMLSGTVRFEGWFVSAAFAGLIVWLHTSSELRRRDALISIAIVSAFPIIWICLSFYHYGDLSGLTASRDQHSAEGTTWLEIGKNTHAIRFLTDVSKSVLVVGVVGACLSFWFLSKTRPVIIVAIIGILLASIAAFATASTAKAAPWRLPGAWVGQLVPFMAMAIVWLARRPRPRLQGPAVIFLSALAIAGLVWTDVRLVNRKVASEFNLDRDILALRGAIGRDIDANSGRVLVDTGKVFFLDVVVALNRAEAIDYTTGTDPIGIALYSEAADYWRATDTPEAKKVVADYLTSQYDPRQGAQALEERSIRFVLLLDGPLKSGTEAMDGVVLRGKFGPWYLFERK